MIRDRTAQQVAVIGIGAVLTATGLRGLRQYVSVAADQPFAFTLLTALWTIAGAAVLAYGLWFFDRYPPPTLISRQTKDADGNGGGGHEQGDSGDDHKLG